MKRLLLGLAFVLLAAQVHAVPLRSLGNLTPTNPEVPSPKFSGTYSQMLSEPATLLQGGDTWDTTDTQAEYIWNLQAQTWVFSLSISVTPTPTYIPASSYTPTATFTPSVTPSGSWTPIATYTQTPIPTMQFAVFPDGHFNLPENPSLIYLHQENLIFSDDLNNWGLGPVGFGLGSHILLRLYGWSDNNQSEIAMNQTSLGFSVAQSSGNTSMNILNWDYQGLGLQQLSWISWRVSVSPNDGCVPVTMASGAATQIYPNWPSQQGTPVIVSMQPVSWVSTPPPFPPIEKSITYGAGGATVIYQGASTDNSVYQPIVNGFYR